MKHDLQHPNDVGSAEYRAIYELVTAAADRSEAVGICEEFISVANDMRKILTCTPPDEKPNLADLHDRHF